MDIQWERVLAARAQHIRASVFVGFDDLPTHPDMVTLAGGAPPAEWLPIGQMTRAMRGVWTTVEPSTLYYGETEGFAGLRELIAARMTRRGVAVPADDVIVTNGAQQALDLATRLLVEPGDRLVVEAPTYFGALQIFDLYQPEYLPVTIDEHGLIPEELERVLQLEPRPKLIYTIPTFQNPTGVSLCPERRRRLVALSARYNVPVVEDDPYGELWFRGGDIGTLRGMDPNVIYLGTFSKTLAPALRMGWLIAPPPLRRLFIDAKEAVDIQSDRMIQRAIVQASAEGWLDEHVDAARQAYRDRRDHLLECLERDMPPGTRWTEPDGGYFAWVTLPDGANTDELLYRAAAAGVLFIPGSAFYHDRQPQPTLRVGFSTLPVERLALGIARLGRVLRDSLD